jgi:Putative Flp pilus-assembly TadE/G-like
MRFRKFREGQTAVVITHGLGKGQIAVVMTLVIATLLGVIALGSDVAVMYYNWMQLQKSADASALAGATYFLKQNATQTLPSPTINPACTYATQQQNVACRYALNNYAQAADLSQGGIYVPAQTVPASTPAGAQTIQVTLTRTNIPVFFMRLLGRTTPYSAIVSSIAVAPTAVSRIHNGIFPAGMPPNPLLGCPANTAGGCLNYGSTFSMTDNYGPGNWGWLNIPNGWNGASGPSNGGGASQLNTNITNGCTCDVKVGDVVATKTGEDWGQTLAAVNTLITGGSLPSTITGKESQLVTVPIVNWGTVNGASTVTVLGFAELWIDSLSKQGSTQTLQVQFVQYLAPNGVAGGSANNYGAYIPPYLLK